MFAFRLACLMVCAGACATTPEPPPKPRNNISAHLIGKEFSESARRHAAQHAKWLLGAPRTREALLSTPEGTQGGAHRRTVRCSGIARLGGRLVALVIDRYFFGAGAVVSVCSVSDSARGYSDTVMRSTRDDGRTCAVRYDMDAPTSGEWAFMDFIDHQVAGAAEYVDKDSKHNGYVLRLPCVDLKKS